MKVGSVSRRDSAPDKLEHLLRQYFFVYLAVSMFQKYTSKYLSWSKIHLPQTKRAWRLHASTYLNVLHILFDTQDVEKYSICGNGFNITDLSQTKEPEAPERRDPSQLELLFVEINDWLHLIVTFLYLG